MRKCPNCGGGLRFDIKSQGLKCPNCSSKFGVGEIAEDKAARAESAMDGTMDAMIFTCPQCGGSVWSTSETAAGFCSFCGASVQLQGRMSKEKTPSTIVPFKLTKEECAAKFREHVKGFFFSPGDMSRENANLEFRGIYMPYWDYTVHQKANVNRKYKDEHRSGDYRIVSNYGFTMDLDDDISGIQHDASTSFDDDLGLAISPFELEDEKEFDSGYMEGFYGDVADTEWEDYADFALDEAVNQTEKIINGQTQGVRTDNGPRGNEEFGGFISDKRLSLFPVWFMSYRSGNRVAYSAVNGQTGRVFVDLPVDIGKFFATTAVLTAVIYVVCSFFLAPTPQMDVAIAMILSIASSVIFAIMSGKILKRDDSTVQEDPGEGGKKKKKKQKDKGINIKGIIAAVGIVPVILIVMVGMFGLVSLEIAAVLVALWAFIVYLQRQSAFVRNEGTTLVPAPVLSMISGILGLVVVILNPVSDFWYYGITTLSMIAAALSLIMVLSMRNLLSTRRLPEFDTHKGGDHRARS